MLVGLATAVANLAPLAGSTNWAIISLLGLVSWLPLLWLGLSKGYPFTIAAGFISLVVIGMEKYVYGLPISLIAFAAGFLAVIIVSRWGLLSRNDGEREEWYPSGTVLVYLTGVSAFITLVTYFMLPADGMPIDKIALKGLSDEITSSSSANLDLYESLVRMMYFYPAINGIASLLLVIGNTALAQKILEARGENIRPKGAFIELRLPNVYLWVIAFVMALTTIGLFGQLGANLLIIAIVPYIFVGLAFVHRMVAKYNLGMISLGVFYLIMLVFGWTIVLVAFMGILEPWLRDHLKNGETKENEG